MAQTIVNIRMDEELRNRMERVCKKLGVNMTTAFTVFAEKMSQEEQFPFEVSFDPFYSEPNLAHLRRGIAALEAGKGVEHDLIEADDEKDMV